MKHLYSIINGKSQAGTQELPVVNPFTLQAETIVHQLNELPPLERPVSLSPLELEDIFFVLRKEIKGHKNELASLAAAETGSPIKYHFYDLEAIDEFLTNWQSVIPQPKENTAFLPKGTVGLFLSANEPIILGSLPVLSALITGNRVIVKPSSKTPSYAHWLVSTLLELGLPSSQLHLLLPSRDLTQTLLTNKTFDVVLSFGNAATNTVLGSQAVSSGTEFIPENEGNDWVYVDESIDEVESIAEQLLWSFTKHNGQMCDAVRGILVHENVYIKLSELLETKLAKIKIGDPQDIENDIGALLSGSSPNKNEFMAQATLLQSPDINDPIIRDGAFAPVCWIKPVATANDAIKLYNAHNPYGLGFSVFSKDQKIIELFTKELRVSRLNINTNPVEINIFSPWGGIKKSGWSGPLSWAERFVCRKVINYGQY